MVAYGKVRLSLYLVYDKPLTVTFLQNLKKQVKGKKQVGGPAGQQVHDEAGRQDSSKPDFGIQEFNKPRFKKGSDQVKNDKLW